MIPSFNAEFAAKATLERQRVMDRGVRLVREYEKAWGLSVYAEIINRICQGSTAVADRVQVMKARPALFKAGLTSCSGNNNISFFD